jgi:hypothetical protein
VVDSDKAIVDAVERIASERGFSMATIAMAWVLHNPVVDSATPAPPSRSTSPTPSPRSTSRPPTTRSAPSKLRTCPGNRPTSTDGR